MRAIIAITLLAAFTACASHEQEMLVEAESQGAVTGIDGASTPPEGADREEPSRSDASVIFEVGSGSLTIFDGPASSRGSAEAWMSNLSKRDKGGMLTATYNEASKKIVVQAEDDEKLRRVLREIAANLEGREDASLALGDEGPLGEVWLFLMESSDGILVSPRSPSDSETYRDATGAAPMPFGGGMFGPWDVGGSLPPASLLGARAPLTGERFEGRERSRLPAEPKDD